MSSVGLVGYSPCVPRVRPSVAVKLGADCLDELLGASLDIARLEEVAVNDPVPVGRALACPAAGGRLLDIIDMRRGIYMEVSI